MGKIPRTPKENRMEVDRVEDADPTDDRLSRLLQINEFLVGRDDEVTDTQSLDGTLTMAIQPGSVDETVMSITRLESPQSGWKQPDLSQGPVPEQGLKGSTYGAFRIQLASGDTALLTDAQIGSKFDVAKIRELAKESKGLSGKEDSQLYGERVDQISLPGGGPKARDLCMARRCQSMEICAFVPCNGYRKGIACSWSGQ